MIRSIGKKLVLLSVLIVLAIPLLLLGIAGTETGTRWLVREVLSLESLGASVETVEGTLLDQLTLRKIRYRSPTERITLDSFSFSWEPSALLAGALHIRAITGSNLLLEILAESEEPPEQAEFTVPEIPLNVFIDAVDLQRLRYKNQEAETVVDRIQLAAELQDQKARLTRLDLQMPALSVQGRSEVELAGHLPMSVRMDWVLRLPDAPEITGETSVQGNLESLNVTGSTSGAVVLEHKATIKSVMTKPAFDLAGNWQKLQWPLSGPAQVGSQQGHFNLSGTAENYRIRLNAKLAAEQLPPFDLALTGQGNTEMLNINELRVSPKQGQLSLDGRISWAKGIGFDLAIAADRINPADFIENVPGSLNLQAETSGQVIAEHIRGKIDIERLDGELRGYPVKARGKLAVDGDQVQVHSLFVQSAKNQLSADGRLTPQKAQLQFSIDAPDLSTVWPGLAGSIEARGSVQGDYRNPVVVTELTADRLNFQDYRIRHLKLAVDYAEVLSRPSTIDFQGQGLSLAGHKFDRLSLDGMGSIRRHQFKAQVDSAEIQVDLAIVGSFEHNRWNGTVEQLTLDQYQLHRWRLAKPWPVSAYQQAGVFNIEFPRGCLIQAGASLCLSLSGPATGPLEARADAKGIELTLFKPWLPEDLSLAGTLSAEAEMLKQDGAATARIYLRIPEALAQIERPNEPPLTIPLSETRLDVLYRQDRLTADAHIGLGGPDFFSAKIKAGPQELQKPRPLSGVIQASIADMSFINALVPEIEKLKGKLSTDLIISGDSERPVISGTFRLNEGGMAVPAAGIAIKNIDLQLTGSRQHPEQLILTGHADSGKGTLDLNGTLDLSEARGFPVRIQVEGNNFEIAKLPQAEIAVSPRLLIKQQRNRTEVSGDVIVDRAKLQLTEIPESAIAPSEDEEIVGAGAPPPKKTALPVLADINIVLGEQVYFSGYGLNTHLKGKLRYTGTAKQQRMQGRVAMSDANYKAYGQDLTVTKGEFLFNGPADNPWLNIQATRKATGEDVTAILSVTGPLKSPVTKVSSNPPLPESEALAYLLTGSSLQNMGQSQSNVLAKAALSYGVGQLSWLKNQLGLSEFEVEDTGSLKDTTVKLGKYLNPNLYIGLSLGFFSNNYVAVFKQKLSEHFSLQTQAGESQRIELKYQLDTN